MKKVRIIVDSSADMYVSHPQLDILPMTLRFGDQEYIHGVTMTNTEFYQKLVESDVIPTTSQIPPSGFSDAFAKAVAAGEQVVAITVSKKLSGTFQSAMIAANDFENDVFVVDSHSVAIGAGILAQYALRLVDKGLCAEEIFRVLIEIRERMSLFATLDTLEYLKKGGRISKSVALVGGMLSIKPVASISNGEIAVIGKARGSKQGNLTLMKEIEKAGGIDFDMPYLLGYTGVNDTMLQKFIIESKEMWDGQPQPLPQTIVGSIVGTHAGPGAVAIAFFRNA